MKKSQVGMGAQFTAEWGRLLTSEKEYRKDLLIKVIFRPEGATHPDMGTESAQAQSAAFSRSTMKPRRWDGVSIGTR